MKMAVKRLESRLVSDLDEQRHYCTLRTFTLRKVSKNKHATALELFVWEGSRYLRGLIQISLQRCFLYKTQCDLHNSPCRFMYPEGNKKKKHWFTLLNSFGGFRMEMKTLNE